MAPSNCDSPVAAPKAAAAGFVRDGATGLPITGCQVLAAGKGALAVTDETGFFYLGDLIEYDKTNNIFQNAKLKSTSDYVSGHFG